MQGRIPVSVCRRSGMGALVALVVWMGPSARAQEVEKIVEADLTVSKDYGVTKKEKTLIMPERVLERLTEDAFAKLDLNDPWLKSGYIWVFKNVVGFDPMAARLSSGVAAARADLYRRRNDAAPLLLMLLRDNPYSGLEAAIMVSIEHIPGIDLAPFLEQARVAVKERGMTMNPVNADCIATFLVRNGTDADWDLLKKWAVDRPYLDDLVKRTLAHGDWVRRQAYGPTMPVVIPARAEEVREKVMR